MTKLSKDLSAGALHPRETLFLAGTLGALNAEGVLPADGCGTVAIDLRGTFNLTVAIEGTIDGTNWQLIPVRQLNVASPAYVAAIAGSVQGGWVGSCAGYRSVRARCSAYTSGAATSVIAGHSIPLDQSLSGAITPLLVTSVGAAGAALTLTLPAPGAGLRQYLTYLHIERYAAAVLTASGTPVTVTSTNLPGAAAFTIPADAAALGALYEKKIEFPMPLAASAQNTAVTIVCPLTTGVIWRVTAGYYAAP